MTEKTPLGKLNIQDVDKQPIRVFSSSLCIEWTKINLRRLIIIMLWTIPNYWIGKAIVGPNNGTPGTKFTCWLIGLAIIFCAFIAFLVTDIIIRWILRVVKSQIDFCFVTIDENDPV
jgi:hypothetical protein